MTTKFDAADLQLQSPPAEASALAETGAKFQADYHNLLGSVGNAGDAKFVKVADTTDTGDAAAQAPGGGDSLKQFLAVDPKELTPNLRTMQGLVGHFDKADDKAKGMAAVKPEVEKTIAASDTAAAAAVKAAEAQATALKPQYEAAAAKLKATQAPLQDAVSKVPEADKKRVGAELGLLVDPKTDAGVKRAIEADLNKSFKGLAPAAKAYGQAMAEAMPIMQKVQEMQQTAEEAASEPVVARMIYADMLEKSGDAAGSKQVQAEAMALQMGMTIEQFRQLQKQQQGGGAPKKPGEN